MRQRKFKFLLVSSLIVAGFLFASGEVLAVAPLIYTCTNAPPGEINYCGAISNANNLGATYVYEFKIPDGATSAPIQYIDIEMPYPEVPIRAGLFTAGVVDNLTMSVGLTATGGTPVSGEVNCPGCGDAGTKFGNNDPRYQVIKINVPSNLQNSPILYLVLKIANQPIADTNKNKWGTMPSALLLKASNGANPQAFEINAPAPVYVPPTAGDPSLSANPTQVEVGLCTTLTWNAPNALFAFISNINDNEPGAPVNPLAGKTSGSLTACPSQELTNYSITAIGPDGVPRYAHAPVTLKPNSLTPTSFSQKVEIAGMFLQYVRSGISGCIKQVETCNADYSDCTPIAPEPRIGGETVLSCSPSMGGACMECVAVTTGSPTCSNVITANGNYSSCGCPANQYWLYDLDGTRGSDPSQLKYAPNKVWHPTLKNTNVAECSATGPVATPAGSACSQGIVVTTGTRQGVYCPFP